MGGLIIVKQSDVKSFKYDCLRGNKGFCNKMRNFLVLIFLFIKYFMFLLLFCKEFQYLAECDDKTC